MASRSRPALYNSVAFMRSSPPGRPRHAPGRAKGTPGRPPARSERLVGGQVVAGRDRAVQGAVRLLGLVLPLDLAKGEGEDVQRGGRRGVPDVGVLVAVHGHVLELDLPELLGVLARLAADQGGAGQV